MIFILTIRESPRWRKEQETVLRGFLCTILALTTAACMPDAPSDQAVSGSCGAKTMQSFVGQPESVLSATTFTGPVRIIHPKDAVTMDLRPERLNFDIDDKGIITRVRCG